MARTALALALAASLFAFVTDCAHVDERPMVVTAYDPGSESCGWRRGRLLFWRKFVAEGPRQGERYTGRTAANTRPKPVRPGLVSWDTVRHPWMAPVRLILFWNLLPRPGTIAADTRVYPFGTRIYVPGWGWGVVEDRGSAIQGPAHIDLFFPSRRKALAWGSQRLTVKVVAP